MPRYDFSPDAVFATIPVLPKGEYEFIVGEPKAFLRQNQKGQDSYGIRFPLVTAETSNGVKKGTRIFFNTYQQSEGAQAIAKQFAMAVFGFKRTDEEEQRFNSEFAGKDWSFNTDTGVVCDAWMELKGKRITGSVDVQANRDHPDQLMQQFPAGCWSPIK